MKNNKRIFVYMEATPAHHDAVAYGLDRASGPILRSIRDYIDGIAIYPLGRRFKNADIDQELAAQCIQMPQLPNLLARALRKHSSPFSFEITNALPQIFFAPAMRRSSSDILLSIVGAEAGNLVRGARLAAGSGRSHAVFLVDDFIPMLRHARVPAGKLPQLEAEVCSALRDASHVFTITDGLGQHVREKYDVSSTRLQLAFEPAPRPMVAAKNQVLYVGGVNFLYADGLRDLFQAVERVRNTSGADLTVRLTQSAAVATRELGALPSFVVAAPIETADGLAQEIASSLFAFLPYSFGLPQKIMVSTSFPSKSMEYFAYARSIVVYGPEYGVATKSFRKAGLPSVVSSPAGLEEMIRSHLDVHPDHSSLYRKYLASSHSLASARKTLCDALGLHAD